MSKMSDTGKDHGNAVLIGCIDGILVTDRASWLDDSLDTGCQEIKEKTTKEIEQLPVKWTMK